MPEIESGQSMAGVWRAPEYGCLEPPAGRITAMRFTTCCRATIVCVRVTQKVLKHSFLACCFFIAASVPLFLQPVCAALSDCCPHFRPCRDNLLRFNPAL